jgi:hypothetical protein
MCRAQRFPAVGRNSRAHPQAAQYRPSFATADGPQNSLACAGELSDECGHRGNYRERTKTMKMFTIEKETNNITVHATAKEAEAVPDSERFSNQAGLAKLAAHWPAARLVEIWNSLPGATPVHKFTDRNKAVGRIWKALQSLGQPASPVAAPQPKVARQPDAPATPVAPPTPRVAPQKASAARKARKGKKAPPLATEAKVQ